MALKPKDLWSLALDQPQIDPGELAEAIEEQASQTDLDYRTRLLIRDSVGALRHCWGDERVQRWLADFPVGARIKTITQEEFERPGFPSLVRRVMEPTKPEKVRQFLRELGSHPPRPTQVRIGGAIALILTGHLVRRTEDVDLVDEVPAAIRSQHRLLERLNQTYNLHLTHFQRHYLPARWEQRLHSLEPFGPLRVSLVDVHDVFLRQLFSAREQDKQDLIVLASHLAKETLARKVKDDCSALLAAADLRRHAEQNWYILYGEALPA
jgi:hypothetical protein